MEDILKHLLDTETQAEAVVEQAKAGARQHVDQAVAAAQAAERAFIDEIPGLHDVMRQQAEQRAAQTLRELERRYQEHSTRLQTHAASLQDNALQAALARVLAD